MQEKEKQVQIPLKTFIGVLLLTDNIINGYDIDLNKVKEIHKILNNKLNLMEKRNLYTLYKTATTEEEKEKARLEYLKKIGLNEDFKW